MAIPEISISGRGMRITPAIKKYVDEKIGKYWDIYISVVTGLEVVCIENKSARGVNQDFKIEITAFLPKTTIVVEKEGADIYGLIDLATDVLIRKIKKYKGKNKKRILSNKDIPESEEEIEDPYVIYTPKISKIKKIEDGKPISPEEAVEKMDMNDYSTYLFRDSKTGFPSLVYKRKDGTNGLVILCSNDK